jgi:hypothetical protein
MYASDSGINKNGVEATNQKEEERKKPKPEEQEGMPQHQQDSGISLVQ